MTAPHKPIHPIPTQALNTGAKGMTLRELYAGQAMQGILADPDMLVEYTHEQIAKLAVAQADSLIKALRDISFQ